MAETIVRARRLVKTFGASRALDGMSLQVDRGEVVGIVGPPGAGKTTAIRVLLGLVRPDPESDPVYVLGAHPRRDAVDLHRRIAYVSAQVPLLPTMTVGETIDFLGRLRGRLDENAKAELVEQFGIDPSKPAADCSPTERHAVAYVSAFASGAEFFIFDEPTTRLEPLARQVVAEQIAKLRADGGTVLLATQSLAVADELCDVVSIVRDGRNVIVARGKELGQLAPVPIRLSCRADPSPLAQLAGVRGYAEGRNAVTFHVEPTRIGEVMRAAALLDLTSLFCGRPTLEDVLARHADDAGRQQPALPLR